MTSGHFGGGEGVRLGKGAKEAVGVGKWDGCSVGMTFGEIRICMVDGNWWRRFAGEKLGWAVEHPMAKCEMDDEFHEGWRGTRRAMRRGGGVSSVS